jgi:hypothetical protein
MHVYSYVACQQTSYISVPLLGADRIEKFPSIVASIHVYRAVAWQRADKIRYNIITADFSPRSILILPFYPSSFMHFVFPRVYN